MQFPLLLPQMTNVLILGLGWQGVFLQELLVRENVTCSTTSTSGRNGTIPFRFDPNASTSKDYALLPNAENIVITFPLPTEDSGAILMKFYKETHPEVNANFVLYGSTRAWKGNTDGVWYDRNGPVIPDTRFNTEKAFMGIGGCVLNLSGLWALDRHPKNWIERVAKSKDELEMKGSLHLIHGLDVARLTLAVTGNFTPGQRWIVTDLRVYDWWELVLALGNEEQIGWVRDLVKQKKVRSLPRLHDGLDRCLDSTDVWNHFGLVPLQTLYKK
jgi:hypothetical protein